jgi:hypothetical protein
MDDRKSPVPLATEIDNIYEITVKGYLDENWSDWLGGLEITRDEIGNSILTGLVPDQAALHGILTQIRDLNLNLVSLTRLELD